MRIKKLFIFLLFFSLVGMPFVSANFACGFINDSEQLAASWVEVLVYYDENPSDYTTCKTSPENKFCCDLEEIESVTWETNKLVYAEVFNENLGVVAGPSSLLTTEDGYNIFQEMQLEKVIKFNKPVQTILINKSSVLLDLFLHENYNNLKYVLNNEPEVIICNDCSQSEFGIDISKGKNEIKLIAYNQLTGREISEIIHVYSLDYLKILDSFECEKCKIVRDKIYVPSNSEVNLNLKLESSHPFSGITNIYFPVSWEVDDSSLYEDYSLTHNLIKWKTQEESLNHEIIIPLTSSRAWWKRKDFFKYEIQDSEFFKERNVLVYRLTRFFPFNKYNRFSPQNYFEKSLEEITSPLEPLILDTNQEIFEAIAIYPTKEISNAKAYLTYKERKFFRRNYISFNLISTLPHSNIDKILFRFKIPKDKFFKFYNKYGNIEYSLYDQDTENNYYEAYISKKGSFRVKIY